MKKGDAKFNLAIPAAMIPFVAPMAAFAAEGTSRVSFTHLCIYKAVLLM